MEENHKKFIMDYFDSMSLHQALGIEMNKDKLVIGKAELSMPERFLNRMDLFMVEQ